MKACERAAVLACLAVTTILCGVPTFAGEASVQWHRVDYSNPTSPPPFAVSPPNPTTLDTITFVAATDGKMYVNSCWASVANGDPGIIVDFTNREIVVSFSDPVTNRACPLVVIPVMGIDGQFGRLAAGEWTFWLIQHTQTNFYTFTVTNELAVPLSIRVLTAGRYELSWPNNGISLAVEFTAELAPANWTVLSNTPVLSGGVYTVEIDSSTQSGFFRLRRRNP